MLFNSYSFIFLFLPITFVLFFAIGRYSREWAAGWLGIASLFFYGYWSIEAVPLLLGSIIVNFYFGSRLVPQSGLATTARKTWLYVAVGTNLLVLGYFKYANFFINNLYRVLGSDVIPALHVALPIGISFYTFTQIAFLVDCWQGKVRERNFVHYVLFVTYFPHLVAGPILHHSQMMPQFAKADTYRINYDKIAIGLAIFTVGLAKKMLIADPLDEYADLLFDSVAAGTTPQFFMSWFGALAYTFQIYFDFSGYSDMAVGLSLLFGIRIPFNFDAPYRATSIIDFWRRWHMSLSAFLRDYVYLPLGGNRLGKERRYINVFVTMLLGGLWHGANWTFVLWGAMHGVLLVINHGWRKLREGKPSFGLFGTLVAWLATFLSFGLSLVMFRSDSVHTAAKIYKGILGLNGFSLPNYLEHKLNWLASWLPVSFGGLWQGQEHSNLYFMAVMALAAFFSFLCPPFAQTALGETKYTYLRKRNVGIALALLLAVTIFMLGIEKRNVFLYFQF